ncbi:7241_t:CDS:2, partial [Funneliformis geosporum]
MKGTPSWADWFVSNDRIATCQVEVITSKICDKKYQHGSSTGILIDHLS